MHRHSRSTPVSHTDAYPPHQPLNLTRQREKQTRRRGGVIGEFWLAVPPTLTVILVVFLIESITSQRLLFASLASSAFLIYYEPLHRMNAVRTMVTSQVIGCLTGIAAGASLGPGVLAGAVSMAATITILIALDLVHPPAISTSLAFSFITAHERTVMLFLGSLLMLGMLVVLQRLAVWTLGFMQRRGWEP